MSSALPFLTNHLLLSMPILNDVFFHRSVVYICEHSAIGALGLIINRPLPLFFSKILNQLKIKMESPFSAEQFVLCGGPVHPDRGFVIHTPQDTWQSSLYMSKELCITVSEDILVAIAKNKGPTQAIFSLGYARWTAGQLEEEVAHNYWLTMPLELDILFKVPFDKRWIVAMSKLGVDISKLVYGEGGHA